MRHRYPTLLAVLFLFGLTPLLPSMGYRPVIVVIAFVAVLSLGALAVARHRRQRWFVGGLGVTALALEIGGAGVTHPAYVALEHVTFLAFLMFVALTMLRDVLRTRRVGADAISGSLCVYILLGIAWAVAYEWLAVVDPDAFRFPSDVPDPEAFFYFSFVTLTTLGYGDITPATPEARGARLDGGDRRPDLPGRPRRSSRRPPARLGDRLRDRR